MTVAVNQNKAMNPPDTLVRTSHSIRIKYNNQTIGLISSWVPAQSKQITPVYELNPDSSGLPFENVPGNVSGLTIQVSRYDIWKARMEEVMGTTDLYMLSNQQSPFSVEERWIRPDGTEEVWTYIGCWFSQIGRSYRSDDNRVVNVTATITYLFKEKTQA